MNSAIDSGNSFTPQQHSCTTALWLTLGFVAFSIMRVVSDGGYASSVPLFLVLAVYCYQSVSREERNIFSYIFTTIKSNLSHIVYNERRVLMLMMVHWLFKLSLLLWYPQGDERLDAPYSLIFFSCAYTVLFILPPLLWALFTTITGYLHTIFQSKFSTSPLCSRSVIFRTINRWKRSSVVIVLLVLLMYVIDSDVTYVLRYLCWGKPCWPVLVPSIMHDTAPLQYAWIKTWPTIFSGYQPCPLITFILFIGREMEINTVLPVLIGIYVLSQIFLPQENASTKRTFFGCIAAVVMSGLCSGMLKLLFHRCRPMAYGNPYMWSGPGLPAVHHPEHSKLDLSFPAGHPTVTTAMATCLHQALSKGMSAHTGSNWLWWWMTVLLYFYPVVVLVNRVSDCYHWPSDVVFGVRQFTSTLLIPASMSSDIFDTLLYIFPSSCSSCTYTTVLYRYFWVMS